MTAQERRHAFWKPVITELAGAINWLVFLGVIIVLKVVGFWAVVYDAIIWMRDH